jgi:hypothetical protein
MAIMRQSYLDSTTTLGSIQVNLARSRCTTCGSSRGSSLLFHEQSLTFDINIWISKRHRSRHAVAILDTFFLQYHDLPRLVGQVIRNRSLAPMSKVRPYFYLQAVMFNEWKGWTPVGRKVSPQCFKSGFVARSLHLFQSATQGVQHFCVEVSSGSGCICTREQEESRPCSFPLTCKHLRKGIARNGC